MKKLGFLFVSLVVLLSACSEEVAPVNRNGGTGIVSGEFPDLSGQKILVKGDDYRDINVDTIYVDQNGFFTYKVFLEKPEYFSFQINRSKVMLYLHPLDSVSMSGNINNLPSSLQFSGSSAVYNNYLTNWIQAQLSFQSDISQVFSGSENSAVRVLDSLKKVQLLELENLELNFSGIDPYFVKTEKARILYTWALNLQNYPRNHAYIHKKYGFEASPNFYSFLAEVNLNDSSLVHIPVYRHFIEDYVYLQTENANKKDSLIIETFGSYGRFRLEQLTKHIKNQQIIDYVAYSYMKSHVHYDGVKDYESLLPYFDSLCQDSLFVADIMASLKPWMHLRKGKPSKDFTYVNIHGDSISLSDFLGKYVFIDVWATWCTPCLAEVPFLLKLEREMTGKNIEFLSISVDQDKVAWEKMVRTSTFSGVQLHAGQSKVLMDFYKITGIPRFMLIDPQGNIVEASSNRPSMNIKAQLMKLPGI